MWTFEADSHGYMFFFNGKPMGGAGAMLSDKGPKGRMSLKQAQSYANYCRAECERRNALIGNKESRD